MITNSIIMQDLVLHPVHFNLPPTTYC